MGNTCKPMAVSFQCMTKFTTNKKKIKKKREAGKSGYWKSRNKNARQLRAWKGKIGKKYSKWVQGIFWM